MCSNSFCFNLWTLHYKKKKENQPSRPTSSEKREKGKEVRGEGEVDWRGTNRYQ